MTPAQLISMLLPPAIEMVAQLIDLAKDDAQAAARLESDLASLLERIQRVRTPTGIVRSVADERRAEIREREAIGPFDHDESK